MSHEEPIDAGSECLDCHTMKDGDIGPVAGGMTRCVSCHNGQKASSACETCHIGRRFGRRGFGGEPQALNHGCWWRPLTAAVAMIRRSPAIRVTASACLTRARSWRAVTRATTSSRSGTETVKRVSSATPISGVPAAAATKAGSPVMRRHGRRTTRRRSPDPTDTCTGCHNGTKGTKPGRNFCIDLCHTDHEEWR